MTTIRKFVYAMLLALSTLTFAPTLASAQEPAKGAFTLPHDVHWSNAVVPAGEYRFSYEAGGAMGMLMLSGMSARHRAGFVLLVSDTDVANPSDVSQLVLKTTPQGSYVTTMQLPEFGMTLHFPVPSHAEKQIAKAGTAPLSPGQ